uniref:Uncharacterized protein n=1 Tax=Arundo donax TaxID=35708 RepID=A0A0A8ZYS8_ARUDO
MTQGFRRPWSFYLLYLQLVVVT